MNYHTRSFSEQPQVSVSAVSSSAQPQSFIRIHSDSQQSLDQLFNPQSQKSIPLRHRNLPPSFFNPSLKTETTNDVTFGTTTNGNSSAVHVNNNLHSRSISFDHHHHQQVPPARATHRPNLHMRTHSTLAPMPQLLSNHSSNQSSQEFLNNSVRQQQAQHDTDEIVSSTNEVSNLNTSCNNYPVHNQHQHHQPNHHVHSNEWSSPGNSMDNLSSNTNWIAGQPTTNLIIPTQQPVQQSAQVVANHQPLIQESVPIQHQQVVHSVNHSPGVIQPTNPVCPNNLHSRSMSYNQRPGTRATGHGFHMRTHSTIAPMSGTSNNNQVNGHVSSHQSSQEFSISSNNITTHSSTGSSSSGYSTDDITAGGHCWTAGQPQPATTQQLPLQAIPMANAQLQPNPTNLHHYQHYNQATVQQQHQHQHQHQHQQPQQTQQQFFYQV